MSGTEPPSALSRLRVRVARLAQALTRRPAEREAPFAELRRTEADPACRALSVARSDAAITDRDAEREAVLHAIEAAAGRLRSLVVPDSGGRAV